MTNLEFRVKRIEDTLQQLTAMIAALQRDVGKLKQDAWQNAAGGGGGGATTGVYFCLPTTLGGATGSWPSLTPSSQSLTVYVVASGALSSIGTKTVYNFFPSAPAASKVLEVVPNGDGTYSAVSQSCT